jgi:hypothetical protein
MKVCSICQKHYGADSIQDPYIPPCEHVMYGERRFILKQKLDDFLREILYSESTFLGAEEEWQPFIDELVGITMGGYEKLIDEFIALEDSGESVDNQFRTIRIMFKQIFQ